MQQPAAERTALGRVTWHQFRHIHSSLFNDLRVPVKIAQEQLGHTNTQTTLNIYMHVVDPSHRAAIEQLGQQLFRTVPKSKLRLEAPPGFEPGVEVLRPAMDFRIVRG